MPACPLRCCDQGAALYLWAAADGRLEAASVLPSGVGRVLYVLRTPQAAGECACYQLGSLDSSDALQSILQLLTQLHMPALLGDASRAWLQQLRDDFAAHGQAFLSTLTDVAHACQGRTVLYIPQEALQEDGTCSG